MASRLDLQPRAPWTICNLLAAQGLAHVLPSLPVGYWQRRVGARAFALDILVRGYEKLGMQKLAADSRRILQATFPERAYLTAAPAKPPTPANSF